MDNRAYSEAVSDALEYIENHLLEPLCVTDVCHLVPGSSWQFQRIFRAYVGDSIGNYIRGRRLARAAQDLSKSTGLQNRLIDIAFKYQFASHEAFTRAFKAEFDILPKEARGVSNFRLIHAKPKVDQFKVDLIRAGISKAPKVEFFGAKKFIGLATAIDSPLGIEAESNRIVSNHWESFDRLRGLILNRKKGISYGISMSPTQSLSEESLLYLAAVEVNEIQEIPNDMMSFELEKTLYASFEVKGFKECCNITTDYIYGLWMPQSEYKRGRGPDFEIFNHSIYRRDDSNSISYYFVPVELK